MSRVLAAPQPSATTFTRQPTRRVGAASVSLALHAAAVLAVCLVVAPSALPPATPPPPSFSVVMEPPPAPAEAQLQPRDLRTPVQTQAALAPPAPVSLPAQPHAELHVSRRAPQKIPKKPSQEMAASPAAPAPVKAEAPAAPAAPQNPPQVSQDALAGLKARIHQAVQEATVYPAIARMMHREGRAQVRFVYEDGVAGEASVAASSNVATLDEAALQAVRRASLPRPPAELRARKLELVVWVDFHLVAQN